MSKPDLTELCVYSIKKYDDLFDRHENNGTGIFTEAKNWASAKRILEKAKKTGASLPIIFADANECDILYYWAVLTDIRITKTGDNQFQTQYSFKNMQEIKGKKKKTALILDSSAKKLDDYFIRSYAICRTPKFIG